MKTLVIVLGLFFLSNLFAQDRENISRPQLNTSILSESDWLQNLDYYYCVEEKSGWNWHKSTIDENGVSGEYPFLFKKMKIIKFKIEEKIFNALVIYGEKKDYIDYYVVEQNELEKLDNGTVWIDGYDKYTATYPEVKIKAFHTQYTHLNSCGIEEDPFIPEVHLLKDKDLIRTLLYDNYDSYDYNRATGSFLFVYNLQKGTSEPLIRFVFRPTISDKLGWDDAENSLTKLPLLLYVRYFETSISNFRKLFQFSKYESYSKKQHDLQLIENKKDSIRLNQLSVYIDSLNRNKPIIYNAKVATTYNDLYDQRNIDSVRYFRYTIERPKIKNMKSEQIPNYSISDLKPNEVFMITIDNRGKVTNTPYQKDYFQGINFLPGKINLYYQLDNVIPDEDNIRHKCPLIKTISLNRSFVTPVSFRTNEEKSTESSISIIKFKIKKDEVEILNKYTNSEGLYQELEQLLTSSKSAITGRYQSGTYYLYLTRKKNYWYLIDEDGVFFRKLDEFSTQNDAVDIVKYQYGNSDTRCP